MSDRVATNEDLIFAALADRQRRKILELLHAGESTLLELSDAFDISFQAVSRHIQLLEEAGLVDKRKAGKYRILTINRQAFTPVLAWIRDYTQLWQTSFDRLEKIIDTDES